MAQYGELFRCFPHETRPGLLEYIDQLIDGFDHVIGMSRDPASLDAFAEENDPLVDEPSTEDDPHFPPAELLAVTSPTVIHFVEDEEEFCRSLVYVAEPD